GEDAGVGGETGKRNTEVGVDWNDLLLVRRELLCIALGCLSVTVISQAAWQVMYLDCGKYRVCFADDADDDGTLLHSFLCVFDLEDTTLGRECHRVVVVVVSEHDGGGVFGVCEVRRG
nr:hypothetical protein [Tanacetum cinerariifolium]